MSLEPLRWSASIEPSEKQLAGWTARAFGRGGRGLAMLAAIRGFSPRGLGLGAICAALSGAPLGLPARSTEPLPDFRAYESVSVRKGEFFDFVRPLVELHNGRILRDRERLERIAVKADLGWFDRRWLGSLADRYGLAPESAAPDELIEALLLRVDIVPVSLALAQAATESGWGTSRFALEGNNLFGEWCFDAGCGLVPRARPDGRRHEVEAFATPGASVASYIHNINTHRSYRQFRRERARLRTQGKSPSGLLLADTLAAYSARREAYVADLKRLIRANELEKPEALGRFG